MTMPCFFSSRRQFTTITIDIDLELCNMLKHSKSFDFEKIAEKCTIKDTIKKTRNNHSHMNAFILSD